MGITKSYLIGFSWAALALASCARSFKEPNNTGWVTPAGQTMPTGLYLAFKDPYRMPQAPVHRALQLNGATRYLYILNYPTKQSSLKFKLSGSEIEPAEENDAEIMTPMLNVARPSGSKLSWEKFKVVFDGASLVQASGSDQPKYIRLPDEYGSISTMSGYLSYSDSDGRYVRTTVYWVEGGKVKSSKASLREHGM